MNYLGLVLVPGMNIEVDYIVLPQESFNMK